MNRLLTLLLIACWTPLTVLAQEKPQPELSAADQVLAKVQSICPVTGEALGSMGAPVKVRIGEQVAFLCCEGCQNKPVVAKHWKKIQERLAAAQGSCPIMGEPVSAEMNSTVVDGQRVFVCCPPCIEKIQANPNPALEKVTANYKAFLKHETQVARDQRHIEAQKICPVTGKPLGSMGDPVKVQVGEEVAFLCCKGCQSQKIDAQHWKTIQANLANAQGVCPVMEEPVDPSMKSTVVQGRRIFVCCPPCIKKIQARPDHFVALLDQQIANGGKPAPESDQQ